MKRLFLADLYRLSKSKGPLILLIASFGFFLINGALAGYMFGNVEWLNSHYEEFFGGNPFIEVGEAAGIVSIRNLADFVSFSSGGAINLFLVALIVIFIIPVRRRGFIKNLASEYKRSSFFFDQALIITIFAFVLTFSAASAMILMSFIFFRGLPVGNPLHLMVHLVVEALLCAAVGIVVLTLTDLMKNQISAAILSLIYIYLMSMLVIPLANTARTFNSGSSFRLQYISLIGNQNLLAVGKWTTVLSSLLVIVLYVGLCIALQLTVIKKRDFI